jgi:sugar transferase (PEP-CTERM/EpsH1 system associated)
MRILWVKIGGLWPSTTGGRLRSLHILSELSRHNEITLVTTHGGSDDPEGLARRLPRVESIAVPYVIPKQGTGRFVAALAQSWLTHYPVDLAKVRVRALKKRVRELLRSGQFDLVVTDFLAAAVNVEAPSPVPKVLFAHNVEHVIWRRLWEVEQRPWRRAILGIEWRKMQRLERAMCRAADLTLAVSDIDAALLTAAAPAAVIRSIPTGVDTEYFEPNGTAVAEDSIVFTGAMDWYPNEDGILHFIGSMLPRIREKMPRASVTIAGRNPTARLRSAAAAAGITLTGTVDDIRPYVARSAVYIVPLRIGGGTRLKIFEALAMGKAVVSTTVGAEGLPLTDGVHFVCADEPSDFAAAVVALLEDGQRRAALGMAGRELVEERYSWRHVAADFDAQCREVIARHEHAR